MSASGALIVSGSQDLSARIWDANTGESKLSPLVHQRAINAVALSPDTRLIATTSAEKLVRLWDVQTGGMVGEPLHGHTDEVWEVSFSRDSRLLASASDDRTVRIWDLSGQQPSTIDLLHCEHQMRNVSISPDSKLIAGGDMAGDVQLWHMDNGQRACDPYQQNEYQSFKCPIAFSPVGTHIASGGSDAIVRVWDIAADRHTLSLEGHTRPMSSIVYSPTGLIIATGSEDCSLRLWDAANGTQLAVLCGHFGVIEYLAFMPDVNSIVSGSSDTTIRIWDVAAALARSPEDGTDASKAVESIGLAEVGLGWLLVHGNTDELLLWVPPEYRSYLNLPSCKLSIAKYRVIMTVENDWHHGENWTACWVGSPGL